MNIGQILEQGGRSKRPKRIGRGTGSGRGKTCTRGHKGVGARAGGGANMLCEGGQMPLFRRLPKRGFNNANFRRAFATVNLSAIETKFDAGDHVTPEALVEAGLLRDLKLPVKVLGAGQLTKKLTIEAGKFSKQAAEKIKAVGGQVTLIGNVD